MTDKKPKIKTYRLIGRQHSGFDEDGKVKDFKKGDKVPLTESQYAAFGDKFEPLNGQDEDEGDPKLTPTLPAVEVNKDGADTVKTDADKAKAAAATGKPASPATGAGASVNSTNTAKV